MSESVSDIIDMLGLSSAKLSKVIFGCPKVIFEVVFKMILVI